MLLNIGKTCNFKSFYKVCNFYSCDPAKKLNPTAHESVSEYFPHDIYTVIIYLPDNTGRSSNVGLVLKATDLDLRHVIGRDGLDQSHVQVNRSEK